MQTQLYFWKPLVEKHKKELTIVEYYYNRTKLQFENIDDEVKSHCQSLYEQSCKNYPNDDIDPSSLAEWISEQGLEMYETLNLIISNHLLMTISMLYHLWEQQLIKFTLKELDHYFEIDKKVSDFGEVKKIFELHGIFFAKLNSYPKIRELKRLANTIKHGDGESADSLRKIRPDFFTHEVIPYDTLEMHGSVLIDAGSINVKESDLFEYINATRNFWDEMPERAYSDTEIIIKGLEKKK